MAIHLKSLSHFHFVCHRGIWRVNTARKQSHQNHHLKPNNCTSDLPQATAHKTLLHPTPHFPSLDKPSLFYLALFKSSQIMPFVINFNCQEDNGNGLPHSIAVLSTSACLAPTAQTHLEATRTHCHQLLFTNHSVIDHYTYHSSLNLIPHYWFFAASANSETFTARRIHTQTKAVIIYTG